jgi:ABC-type Fe3+ transport system permease subunit
LAAVIDRALSFSKVQRYPDCTAMRQALIDLHPASRTLSPAVPQPKRAPHERRRRVAFSVLLALLVLFIGGVAASVVLPPSTLHTEMRRTQTASRSTAAPSVQATSAASIATALATSSALRAKPPAYSAVKSSASKVATEPSHSLAPPLPTSTRDPMEIRR